MNEDSRLWEIDLLRGIAILMMIIFHTLFDLNFFRIIPVDVITGFWRYFAYATASLFLFIVGVSLIISHARAGKKMSGFPLIQKYLVRGAGIFCLGLLVTVATWLYLGEGFVIFGILHLIGISVMLSPLFFGFKKFNIFLGAIVIGIGYFLAGVYGVIWLLPVGIHPATFWSVDYTPLFPWFGVVLIGMGIGSYLYPQGTRLFPLRRLPDFVVNPLSFLGRHSLVIYLVHQPVIILLLSILYGIPLL